MGGWGGGGRRKRVGMLLLQCSIFCCFGDHFGDPFGDHFGDPCCWVLFVSKE